MKLFRLIAAAVVLAAAAPAAFADKKSESFVQANADVVLGVLNDRTLTPAQRETKFGQYMNQFANMEAIAKRVIGVKARSLNDAEFKRYYDKFETYALEVYQVHFDQFRGETLRVTGSKDDGPQRSTVESVIKSSETGKDTKVFWDVLLSNDGKTYRVRDVGIELGGSILWLAQEQQAQFVGFLNNNNGDINKLIGRIDVLLADMDARKKDGRGSAYKG
ncbi:MAG: ABC transporter substrate-binding protein [Hyphomonadaceae bacterium]